jgi:type IV pilus assembly protein PilA
MQLNHTYKHEAGFTLIEIMIVVAIIGLLAAIAVPNFIVYRDRSRVAAAVGTSEEIRAALASFAADSAQNLYPPTGSITSSYSNLRTIVNRNGATLPPNAIQTSFSAIAYVSADGANYTLTITTTAPAGLVGRTLIIAPTGIIKQ